MKDLLKILEEMAIEGYGVMWHAKSNEYRPFEIDNYSSIIECHDGPEGSIIECGHGPEDCGNQDFELAVRATYEEMRKRLGP